MPRANAFQGYRQRGYAQRAPQRSYGSGYARSGGNHARGLAQSVQRSQGQGQSRGHGRRQRGGQHGDHRHNGHDRHNGH